MKILIATGASGGHIFPALGLADELKGQHEIKFICDKGWPLECIGSKGFEAAGISVSKRRGGLAIFPFLVKLFKSFGESCKIINDFQPDIMVGFGSYVSFPAAVAVWFKRVPILIHEQNVFPGSANRIIAHFAKKVAVSFVDSKGYLPEKKTVVTGCPIRKELTEADEGSALKRFGMREDKFTILVLGGSQGSRNINFQFLQALREMKDKEKLQVIHLTGKTDYEEVNYAYQDMGIAYAAFAFLEEMGYAYKLADLVVSRAGASAIAEITFFGKPAILIPYPFAGNHQLYNARLLNREGAAILLEDKDLSAQRFKENILRLMDRPDLLEGMSRKSAALATPQAASLLGSEIKRMAGRI